MKLIVQQDHLNTALSIVEGAINSKTKIAAYKCVLFEADNGYLRLSATDLSVHTTCSVPCQVQSAGSIAIQIEHIEGLIKELKSEALQLKTDGANLVIVYGRSRATVGSLPRDEFPVEPNTPPETVYLSLRAPYLQLRDALRRTGFAAEQENTTRTAYGGVLFKPTENYISLVATDGYRLSHDSVPVVINHRQEGDANDIIVPLRSVRELDRITGKILPKDVDLSFTPNAMIAALEDRDTPLSVRMISRLIVAQYPRYHNELERAWRVATKVTVGCRDIRRALDSVLPFSARGNDAVDLFIADGTLTLAAVSSDGASAKATINASVDPALHGISLRVNRKYLADALNAMQMADVQIGISGDDQPVVFRAPYSPDFIHVVMPIVNNSKKNTETRREEATKWWQQITEE